MAYADGVLAPEEHRAVERVLAADAEARRMVWLFRLSRDIARLAFSAPMWQPAPARHVLQIAASDCRVTSRTAATSGTRWTLALRLWGALVAGLLATVAMSDMPAQQGSARETGNDER